jgi:hypothetical protein
VNPCASYELEARAGDGPLSLPALGAQLTVTNINIQKFFFSETIKVSVELLTNLNIQCSALKKFGQLRKNCLKIIASLKYHKLKVTYA